MTQIKIYIVTTKLNLSEPFNLDYYLISEKLKLSLLFGGLTEDLNTKNGYWINEKEKKLEKDKVIIWEILTDKPINRKKLSGIIRTIKRKTQQISQLYTIDNKPFFL